jgi:hypothetical protein
VSQDTLICPPVPFTVAILERVPWCRDRSGVDGFIRPIWRRWKAKGLSRRIERTTSPQKNKKAQYDTRSNIIQIVSCLSYCLTSSEKNAFRPTKYCDECKSHYSNERSHRNLCARKELKCVYPSQEPGGPMETVVLQREGGVFQCHRCDKRLKKDQNMKVRTLVAFGSPQRRMLTLQDHAKQCHVFVNGCDCRTLTEY